MKENVIAVDLGGTNARAAIVDPDGKVLKRLSTRTPRKSSAEAIINSVSELINELKEADKTVQIVGMGLAALVDIQRNRILESPNLSQLKGVDLKAELLDRTGLPVILENDATAAAIGENWLGSGKGVDHMICVTLGTGVGGGIIVNGEAVHGADGYAGEIGHICIDPDGPVCGCLSNGCLEQYASANAIKRFVSEGLPSNPDSRLNGIERVTPRKVFEAAVKGDAFSVSIFQDVGRYLGIGLAGLVNLLNPEVIVITGGVSDAWELFIEETNAQVRKRAWNPPAERVKIVRGQLRGDAGLIGAAKCALAYQGSTY